MRLWAELRPEPRWGTLQRSPDPLAGFKGVASQRGGGGRKGEVRGGNGKGRRGARRERKEKGGEVDSDAQLVQGRRLAKAGPGR